jgi:hypothetical protein
MSPLGGFDLSLCEASARRPRPRHAFYGIQFVALAFILANGKLEAGSVAAREGLLGHCGCVKAAALHLGRSESNSTRRLEKRGTTFGKFLRANDPYDDQMSDDPNDDEDPWDDLNGDDDTDTPGFALLRKTVLYLIDAQRTCARTSANLATCPSFLTLQRLRC